MNCKYCGKFFEGRSLSGHIVWCSERPIEDIERLKTKVSIRMKGTKHSEETKLKISRYRIAYLKEHPDKVPYKLNHSSRQTYPEIYFQKCLPNFVYQYKIPETLYEGDFVNPDSKIIIEIDGEQHYYDTRIVLHDIKRTAKLEELGWKVIRIRWRDFITLDRTKKEEIVKNLNKDQIENFNIENYLPIKKKCIDCDIILKDKRSIRCKKCASDVTNNKLRKFEITKESLEKLIKELPMTKIGKLFNVSDNSIRKRCKKLGIDFKNIKSK